MAQSWMREARSMRGCASLTASPSTVAMTGTGGSDAQSDRAGQIMRQREQTLRLEPVPSSRQLNGLQQSSSVLQRPPFGTHVHTSREGSHWPLQQAELFVHP
jgi:hypothetical protein